MFENILAQIKLEQAKNIIILSEQELRRRELDVEMYQFQLDRAKKVMEEAKKNVDNARDAYKLVLRKMPDRNIQPGMMEILLEVCKFGKYTDLETCRLVSFHWNRAIKGSRHLLPRKHYRSMRQNVWGNAGTFHLVDQQRNKHSIDSSNCQKLLDDAYITDLTFEVEFDDQGDFLNTFIKLITPVRKNIHFDTMLFCHLNREENPFYVNQSLKRIFSLINPPKTLSIEARPDDLDADKPNYEFVPSSTLLHMMAIDRLTGHVASNVILGYVQKFGIDRSLSLIYDTIPDGFWRELFEFVVDYEERVLYCKIGFGDHECLMLEDDMDGYFEGIAQKFGFEKHQAQDQTHTCYKANLGRSKSFMCTLIHDHDGVELPICFEFST